MSETNVAKDLENKTIVIERVFDAPRERVWGAWTNPEVLASWWGPHGWQTTIKEFDFRPGGVWLYGMRCEDKDQGEFYGQESWGKAIYIDIDEPHEFTYEDHFSDAEGNVNGNMPVMTITMQFIDTKDGKTKLVSRGVFDSIEGYDKVIAMGVVEGITQTWDRLEEQLLSNKEGK